MDWRWPTLGLGLAAAAGAAAGVWHFRPDPIAAGGAGLAVAAMGAALLNTVARQRDAKALRKDLAGIQAAQRKIETELSQARSGMMAVQEILQNNGAAQKERLTAMEDEVAVLQKLVARLEVAAAPGAATARSLRRERSADGLSNAQVLELVRGAVSDGAVDLFLQPIVDLPQRRRRYFECFSRVPDQHGGVLTAEAYVRAAEAAGLIGPIDNLLLFRAVQLVRRARSQNAHVAFFCNVSRHTLRDRSFLTDFLSFLEENPELAPSLILEVAQADWDPEDAQAMRYMDSLASLGVRFSLDQITNFNLDAQLLYKRGFRFVKATAEALLAENGPETRRLKRALAIDDIQLIVEKIERERDLVELLEHDIDLGQGYLFGEPRAPLAAAAA